MSLHDATALAWNHIQEARYRIADRVHGTPVLTSDTLDAQAGAKLFFKCENFQKSGSFKARGATNAVFSLSDAAARPGVTTHSSGNHAAALARAARLRGIPAHIVMPNNAPRAKRAAVQRYGGTIVLCEPTSEARELAVRRVIDETGATLVHAYNDLNVMAGQATTAVEFLRQVSDLDVIVCPVGGGGHLSGIAVAAKNVKPHIQVIGVEPAGADDAARSFLTGKIVASTNPQTIADGLRTSLGEKPFAEIKRYVDDIVTVSECAIVDSMRKIWEVMKIVVEPSGAVALASIADRKINAKGRRVGVILTGGNLDLDRLPWEPPI